MVSEFTERTVYEKMLPECFFSAVPWRVLKVLFAALLLLSVVGCASSPPSNTSNLCDIFDEKDDWYDDAVDSKKRWGTPIEVMMAMIKQESSFKDDAAPPRTKILWIIPGPRKSSAYGYAQAKDGTWDWYMKSAGRWSASRDDFDDAIDFVGWYNHQSHKRLGIKKNDTYNIYLAYHEGHGGFERKTYRKKSWLMKTAKKVARQAKTYGAQLRGCEKRLQSGGWWIF